jgi:hypothetical protein
VHAASRRLIIYRPLAVNFMTVIPVSLSQVSATFSDICSSRIISQVNDYNILIPHGEKAGRVRLVPQERMFWVPMPWRRP